MTEPTHFERGMNAADKMYYHYGRINFIANPINEFDAGYNLTMRGHKHTSKGIWTKPIKPPILKRLAKAITLTLKE